MNATLEAVKQIIFATHDELSGDGLRIALDRDRLIVRVDAADISATVVVVERGAARRLVDNLKNALDERARGVFQ
jgi:hypothetical protein